MYTVLFVVVAYLLGSISFALVSSKLFGLRRSPNIWFEESGSHQCIA